jgi:biotin synthase-related radical SAM superfamily protein
MSSLKPTTELTTAINDTRKPGTLKNFEKIKMRVTKKTNAESTTSSLSTSNNCLLNDGALKSSRSEGPKKVVKRGIENTERIASWKTSSEHHQKHSEEISIDQTKEIELTSKSASLKRKTMATGKKEDNACQTKSSHTSNISDMKYPFEKRKACAKKRASE